MKDKFKQYLSRFKSEMDGLIVTYPFLMVTLCVCLSIEIAVIAMNAVVGIVVYLILAAYIYQVDDNE